jgi:hypothetical protein
MASLTRRDWCRVATAAALLPAAATAGRPLGAATTRLEVFKSPYCGCCGAWVEHMAAHGFDAVVSDVEDLTPIKDRNAVPAGLRSCHTALIDGYVIEGHVPAAEVTKLLTERPAATGLAVPGMPIGSPGMEMGDQREPFDVVLFGPGSGTVFARY